MHKVRDLYIDGAWHNGLGTAIESLNPATGTTIWKGHSANSEQISAAIFAARSAFGTWMSLSLEERSHYLEKFTKIITAKQQELAQCLSQETGKPLWESKTEITAMIGKLAISKQAIADRCKKIITDSQGITSVTRHKPHGVVVVLGPFNFPGHLPNGHIIPALLAGNTIVFKPSELTTMFAVKMLECWEDAELPPGVLNMVIGAGDIGRQLVENPQIDAIFFTGSYETGHKIEAVSLNYPKRIVAAEMGGNNPLVVYKPSNIDAAVYVTVQSAFTTAGQRCTCARRLIVHKDHQGEKFIKRLIEVTARLDIGTYTDNPEPFLGPVISNDAANKILSSYQAWVDAGATVLLPMKRLKDNLPFLTPGIIDVTNVSDKQDEEIFGPLLRLQWVDNFEGAIREANNTSYGLSAGLLCDDPKLYQQFLQYITAGIVNWNRPTVGSSSSAPFGGLGKSGNHRPSAYYAADYCSYPVASMEANELLLPKELSPGVVL
jgi:succinylglutamic semialdehyde dehydrogenase